MKVNLGFACEWHRNRIATWSHTPYFVSEALKQIPTCNLVDLDVSMPLYEKALRVLAGLRYVGGLITKTHLFAPNYLNKLEKNLALSIRGLESLDAILEIGDLGVPGSVPFYILTDLSIDMIIKHHEMYGNPMPRFESFSAEQIKRRRDWQLYVYRRCSGFFTMSEELAKSLAVDSGIARSKIHVVHAGAHVVPPLNPFPASPDSRPRILFVGREFYRKGGDLVVEAFKLIRNDYPEAVLSVAGPKQWPMKGEIPEGVEFLGDTSWQVLQESYQVADVFCMPSHNEGFGIVFAEALCFGVPCIGRNAGVMREIIMPGKNGYLLESDDKKELASLILRILKDDGLRDRVKQEAAQAREYYSWSRIASQIVETIRKDLICSKT